jgi:hypothetical protein
VFDENICDRTHGENSFGLSASPRLWLPWRLARLERARRAPRRGV